MTSMKFTFQFKKDFCMLKVHFAKIFWRFSTNDKYLTITKTDILRGQNIILKHTKHNTHLGRL